MSGQRIVGMAHEQLTLSKILTRAAFENAIRTNAAIGGSTHPGIPLKAIPRTPPLVALHPSGRFLMEAFYYAGGLPAVLRRLGENHLLPHPEALTVNGKT